MNKTLLRKFRLVLSLVIMTTLFTSGKAFASSDAASYTPTDSHDARSVPTYVLSDSTAKTQTLYNPDTAGMAVDICRAVGWIEESDKDVELAFSAHGYSQFKEYVNNLQYSLGSVESTDLETIQTATFPAVNAGLGLKKVEYNGQTKYAVLVAFRGTDFTDYADVLADIYFFKNSAGMHTGFAENAGDFYEKCSSTYFDIDGRPVSLSEMFAEMQEENSQYSMVVTGHSLGGAIADIFVGYYLYNAGVHPSNVVAYTFAPPCTASSSYSYPYTNIINIINEDDLVPKIGNDKQIGTNIYFSPADDFRAVNYGDNYVEGHDSDWWSGLIHSAGQGFVPHLLKTSYTPIVKEVICKNVADYFPYNTSADNLWSIPVRISQSCYGNYKGSLEARDSVVFDSGHLEVGGDCAIGTKSTNGYLSMTHEDDYLMVRGDFTIGYYSAYADYDESLTAGTVELKGNFTEAGYSDANLHYCETGTHKTIFSGEGTQTISFANPDGNNKFTNLILRNTDINFATPIYQLILNQDLLLHQNLQVNYNIDLNGYTFVVLGNLNYETLDIHDGNLINVAVTGDVINFEICLTQFPDFTVIAAGYRDKQIHPEVMLYNFASDGILTNASVSASNWSNCDSVKVFVLDDSLCPIIPSIELK